jgi:hypothetical protein
MDSNCQKRKKTSNIEILSMNYMKILITNPDLQGNIYIDEMTYTYDSENNSIERFLIPQIQKFHPYRKQ